MDILTKFQPNRINACLSKNSRHLAKYNGSHCTGVLIEVESDVRNPYAYSHDESLNTGLLYNFRVVPIAGPTSSNGPVPTNSSNINSDSYFKDVWINFRLEPPAFEILKPEIETFVWNHIILNNLNLSPLMDDVELDENMMIRMSERLSKISQMYRVIFFNLSCYR